MGTTPKGFPYPEPTDPIAAGADAIRALAQAVDAVPAGVTQLPVDYAGVSHGPGYYPAGISIMPVTPATAFFSAHGTIVNVLSNYQDGRFGRQEFTSASGDAYHVRIAVEALDVGGWGSWSSNLMAVTLAADTQPADDAP